MVQFINIVKGFNDKVNSGEKDVELHNWLALLTKFTDDKNQNMKLLPYKLTNSIDSHFSHYWKNDWLGKIESNDIYLSTLPWSVRRKIMTNYLFKDIFYNFRSFFMTFDYKESKYLYKISFGFKPRKFEKHEVIYDEGDDV